MRDDRGETRNRRIPVSRRQIRWRWLIAEVQEQRRTLDKVVMIARWKRTSGTSGCNLSILDEQARARKASRMPDDPWLSPQLRERGHDATVCTREIVWFKPIASAYEILLARRYLRSRVRRISNILLCGRCVYGRCGRWNLVYRMLEIIMNIYLKVSGFWSIEISLVLV